MGYFIIIFGRDLVIIKLISILLHLGMKNYNYPNEVLFNSIIYIYIPKNLCISYMRRQPEI